MTSLDWRDVPLLTALSFGVQSVEADVWLINGTLFVSTMKSIAFEILRCLQVGHERAALTPSRTLASLYIQPLLEILNGQNPKNEFTSNLTTVKSVQFASIHPSYSSNLSQWRVRYLKRCFAAVLD